MRPSRPGSAAVETLATCQNLRGKGNPGRYGTYIESKIQHVMYVQQSASECSDKLATETEK